MSRNRTTARTVLVVAVLLGVAVVSVDASARTRPVPHLVFPVVGQVQYVDDFGAPRAGGAHQGIDIMATKKSPAVAAEAGRVKYWTSSATAGCMLYLYGASGTMYEYIHLNNDLTMRNDNRGKCVRGTAYAVRNGVRVTAGEQIAYVGDSGDANGLHAHLHFEVHPGGARATDPYPYLQAAQRLLFAAKAGSPFALTLTGRVVAASDTELTVNVSTSQAWPSSLVMTKLDQQVVLAVSPTALIQTVTATGSLETGSLAQAAKGEKVVVWTEPAPASLKAERADDGVLTAALVQLSL
jgi:peptidase M23-like protein